LPMLPAKHVEDKEIVETVAIEIGEVDPHGKPRGLAESKPRYRAEFARALVDPDSIGGKEIVAHINVGQAVAVDVPEHCRETPIVRRLRQRFAVFVEKRAAGKGDRDEICSALIAIKNVRFPQLLDAVLWTDNKPVGQI